MAHFLWGITISFEVLAFYLSTRIRGWPGDPEYDFAATGLPIANYGGLTIPRTLFGLII